MAIFKGVISALVVSLVILVQTSHAFTESENLGYIEKILGLLNNREKCQLPTYEEIDDLQRSFNELQSLRGVEFGAKLTPDQKLALDTVLDQWGSFQRYLTGATVTKSAKKRAFLGKVEKYQEEKYGFSICTQSPDDREKEGDSVYEKNPLVRYVKQLHIDGAASVDVAQPASGEKEKVVGVEEENKKQTTSDTTSKNTVTHNGGPNGNDPFADEADVTFKFKVHPNDPNENVRQYGGRFTYRDGRTPHRITLNIHKK